MNTRNHFTAAALMRLFLAKKRLDHSALRAEKASLMADPQAQRRAEWHGRRNRIHDWARSCVQANQAAARERQRHAEGPHRSRHCKAQ